MAARRTIPAAINPTNVAWAGAAAGGLAALWAMSSQPFFALVAPVTWGESRAALMVFHDQTARINTERMRADFLANASHELKTPLASLKLLIETVAGPARDNAADRD